MIVCDKCRQKINGESFHLKFTTKEFEICYTCAREVVGLLEKPINLGDRLSRAVGGRR